MQTAFWLRDFWSAPPGAPSAARQSRQSPPWLALWPGVAISAAVFGFNMFGDALRDLLDPRLRGSR